MWALGTEPGSFVRATGALSLSVIFLAFLFGCLGAESHSTIFVQQEANAFWNLACCLEATPQGMHVSCLVEPLVGAGFS